MNRSSPDGDRLVRDTGVAAIAGAFALCLALASAASSAPAPAVPAEKSARSSIARATPLLTALETHKAREGRYPQYLDQLIPRDLGAIPLASGSSEAKSPFVYDGKDQSFELFFLLPSSSDLFLYRSSHDYPARRESGPYELVKRVGDWAWYRVIPMRKAVVVRQWKGRLPLEKGPLGTRHVTDAASLEKIWAMWEIGEPMPRVDFTRQIVLVAIVRSGLVTFMEPMIDDRGDLKRNVVATPDAPSFLSWAVCVIEREGIRSVDGQPL
ncbi:MAG: hypothetical protein ABR524_11860 [Thermoanaerobaculia bacterium]